MREDDGDLHLELPWALNKPTLAAQGVNLWNILLLSTPFWNIAKCLYREYETSVRVPLERVTAGPHSLHRGGLKYMNP